MSILRRFWLVVAPLMLGALLGWSVYQGILNAKQGQAICALRHDLERRVLSSYKFLEVHPHGIPGISRATILKGISDQDRTIRALSGVAC